MNNFLAVFKLPLRIIFVFFVTGLILLLLPEGAILALKLEGFLTDFGKYIGIVTIVSAAVLVVNLAIAVWKTVRQKSLVRAQTKRVEEKMKRLDTSEKGILREFYLQQKTVIYAPIEDGSVIALIEAGVLRQVGNLARASLVGRLISVEITQVGLDFVDPGKIGLPIAETITMDHQRQLREGRPRWQEGIDRMIRIYNV